MPPATAIRLPRSGCVPGLLQLAHTVKEEQKNTRRKLFSYRSAEKRTFVLQTGTELTPPEQRLLDHYQCLARQPQAVAVPKIPAKLPVPLPGSCPTAQEDRSRFAGVRSKRANAKRVHGEENSAKQSRYSRNATTRIDGNESSSIFRHSGSQAMDARISDSDDGSSHARFLRYRAPAVDRDVARRRA